MPQSTNGKHPRIAIEIARPGADSAESTAGRIESALGDVHEQVVAKSSAFIRDHPGASILLAATMGGVIGWLIKRRG